MRIYMIVIAFFCGSVANAEIFVVAAGANRSIDRRTAPLEYASQDASEFAKTMTEVGGVPASGVFLERNPTLAQFEKVLGEVSTKLKAVGEDKLSKFIFFFSGHADERGLHFSDGFYSKNSLDRFLAHLPVKTKVLVIDSCFAGILSSKGIKKTPGFGSPKMNFDEPSGSIYLTASSSNEMAFESRKFQGGLFSRSIIAGLQGKADSNSDGIVTATELYEFAFRETQLTSRLLPVPSVQNPEFVSNLRGRGAVALSFPSMARGDVKMTSDLGGSIKLFTAKGVNTFDHVKSVGKEDTITLPAGDYKVQVTSGRMQGQGDLRIASNSTSLLTYDDLTWQGAHGHESAYRSRGLAVKEIVQPRRQLVYGLGSRGDFHRIDADISLGKVLDGGWTAPLLSLSGSFTTGLMRDEPTLEEYRRSQEESRDLKTEVGQQTGLHLGGAKRLYQTASGNFSLTGALQAGLTSLRYTRSSLSHSQQVVVPTSRGEFSVGMIENSMFLTLSFERFFRDKYLDATHLPLAQSFSLRLSRGIYL